MDVRAIVLVVGGPEGAPGSQPATIAGTPFALADVLGRPAIHHLLRNLKGQSVNDIVVISDTPMPALAPSSREEQAAINWTIATGAQLWRAAENCFIDMAQNGAEEILVLRVGPYVEADIDSLLQAHVDQNTHATRAIDRRGMPMDLLVVTASRRNEAAYLFRHRLRQTRTRCGGWPFRGYWNALESAQHLRCMAVDALLGENSIVPVGSEVRPGVWIARGAQVHPRARVLAPAYVGEHARIRCNAVVTRCSVVEHHAEVDYGTVIEDATVLPYAYVGPGLDVMRCVAGPSRVASFDHGVEVEISDPRLLRALSPSAGRRALANAASLAAFLPVQFFRGLFRSRANSKPAALSAAVNAPSALNTPPGFPSAPSAVEASSYQRSWQ